MLTVDVALADVDVLLAEVGWGVMTSENGEDLPRPEAAVRDRLDEVRRCLAEPGDRWHGNAAGRFHGSPPRSADRRPGQIASSSRKSALISSTISGR